MKKTLIGIIVLLVVLVGGVVLINVLEQKNIPATPQESQESQNISGTPAVEIVAQNLEIPWDIAFLPDGGFLVTERTGRVLFIDANGAKSEIHFEDVEKQGEGGLLGMVLHPDFEHNHLLYLYMTTPSLSGGTENRVVQYRFENNMLTEESVIVGGIPGAAYHDGGRIEFGPDGLLYITTGDATITDFAQDRFALAGKILRLKDNGTIPENNPFGTAIYSYGHRNPQGLAWDSDGRLWETEHGRSGVLSGLDEINFIVPGENYGWPEIEGDETRSGMVTPARNSGARDTWAPASAAYLNGSLFFGGLRGEALYEAVLENDRVVLLKEHFKGELGRIRTVRVGPDNMLYLTTSNRDGRGMPLLGDDKIFRVDPTTL